MAVTPVDQIMQKVRQTDKLYWHLMLIVAPVGAGKTKARPPLAVPRSETSHAVRSSVD